MKGFQYGHGARGPRAVGTLNGNGERFNMAKKDGGELAPALLGFAAGFAAEYVTRKALTFAWTRATGEEPPTDLESPDVGLGHALGWAVIAGVGVEIARVLAVRTARKGFVRGDKHEPES